MDLKARSEYSGRLSLSPVSYSFGPKDNIGEAFDRVEEGAGPETRTNSLQSVEKRPQSHIVPKRSVLEPIITMADFISGSHVSKTV